MRIMTDIDGCIGDFCAMASDFMGIDNLPEPDAFDLFEASEWKEYFPTALSNQTLHSVQGIIALS